MADLTGNPSAAVDVVMPDINVDGSTPASPAQMNTRYQQLLDNDARLNAKIAGAGSAPTIAQQTTLTIPAGPGASALAPAGVFYFYWGGSGTTEDEKDLVVEVLINGYWRPHPHRFWQTAGPAGHAAGLIISTGANIRFNGVGLGEMTVQLTRIALAAL